MLVKEIMTKNPVCCMPDSNLREVSQMMIDNDCGCIPVVEDKNSMKPVGTITDRDITIRTVAAGKNPLEMTASEIMTTGVVTVKPGFTVEKCAQIMKQNDIRRVLVVDQSNKCCGIVAQADIADFNQNSNLVGDVVQDISESNHTPVKSDSKKTASKKSDEGKKGSLLSLSSVLPLAVGVAAGAAYKYLYSSADKSAQKNIEKFPTETKSVKTTFPIENTKLGAVDDKTTKPNVENVITESKKNMPAEKNETKHTPEVGLAAKPK